MKVVITGGTGFIGRRLCLALLRNGYAVAVVSRDAYAARKLLTPTVSIGASAASGAGIQVVAWDSPDIWRPLVADAAAVFHLAGAPIAGEKWTPEYKTEILRSRLRTTRWIAEAGPKTLISASAIGYYGDRGNDEITESEPAGTDYLATLCDEWEQEATAAEEQGGRVCRMRLGTVLGKDGGALQAFLDPPNVPFSPWKTGLGGPMGTGKQWMSWVHIDDVISSMHFCAFENPEASGPINVVAPNPIHNADFAHAIGRAIHRPAVVPTPAFALKAVVGEMAYALLYSQRVVPAALLRLGYKFRYTDIDAALAGIRSSITS